MTASQPDTEQMSGYCMPCRQGDHSEHKPNLGGICIGCACPFTPDSTVSPADQPDTALGDCDCGHPLWWHESLVGCCAHHYGQRMCWCRAEPSVLLAARDRRVAAEALRDAADAWHEHKVRQLGPTLGHEAAQGARWWLRARADALRGQR